MSDLPTMQIVIVSPNGEEELGPLIVSKDRPLPQYNEQTWDGGRCTEELPRFLRSKDGGGIEATMRAMDRLDCWRACLDHLIGLPTPDAELGEGLLWFWVTYGFHIASSLKSDTIFIDGVRRFVPPYEGTSTTLYRGELQSRHLLGVYGIAWTSKLKVAEMFAGRRDHLEDFGVVLQIEAGPETIVYAGPAHSEYLQEDEYLVDSRLIHGVQVL